MTAPVELALRDLLAERPVAWETLGPADWASLPQQAKANGVAALVYHFFQTQQWPAALPAPTRAALTQSYYGVAAQTTLYFAELARLLNAWQRAQIPFIVLKGAALATTVYADPALRPLGDLDVLVPEGHFAAALAAAQALGYGQTTAAAYTGVQALVEHAVDLRGAGGQVALELHWHLIAGPADIRAPDLGWFWANTRPWQYAQCGGQQLNPTAQVLYLTAHLGLQHATPPRRLIWFYDLHLVLQREAAVIDWALVWDQATAWQWLPAVIETLRELQTLLGTPLPATVCDRLVAAPLTSKPAPAPTRLSLTWHKLTTLHWAARWQLALSLLFPSPAYMRWRYHPNPAWLWPLCYLWRWWDVAWELARTLWRMARARIARGR